MVYSLEDQPIRTYSSLWHKLRFWLIEKIAGKYTVVLNAEITIEDNDSDFILDVDCPHLLFCSNILPANTTTIIKVGVLG